MYSKEYIMKQCESESEYPILALMMMFFAILATVLYVSELEDNTFEDKEMSEIFFAEYGEMLEKNRITIVRSTEQARYGDWAKLYYQSDYRDGYAGYSQFNGQVKECGNYELEIIHNDYVKKLIFSKWDIRNKGKEYMFKTAYNCLNFVAKEIVTIQNKNKRLDEKFTLTKVKL